jgi:adenosine/AMP kinase
MQIEAIRMKIPEGANLILGQAHFIKTAEDLAEALVNTVPGIRYGLAFNEASGPRLVRVEANDDELRQAAIENALAIGAGHIFVILLRQAFPINVLQRIQSCPEVCRILCATANPLQVLVVTTDQGRGVVGVVDGASPLGVEGPEEIRRRREFVRQIGYKF